jgi:paraquat-inducible protein A
MTARSDASATAPRLAACPGCDALLRIARGRPATFRCPRCGAVVCRPVRGRPAAGLALYCAAMIFFLLANSFPIVAIEAAGSSVDSTLLGAARALHAEDMDIVALVVIATTVVFPALDLLCAVALLLLAEQGMRPHLPAVLFRMRAWLRPWNMVEIFVLGTLVAIVKLGAFASVLPGIGIWSLGAFIAASAAAAHAFDPADLWNDLGEAA